MHLVPVGLRGRRFLIQFGSLMNEFGCEIPWLEGMDHLRYATNGEHFAERILLLTGHRHGRITPYQFLESGRPQEFLGGILHFSESPESFRDSRNGLVQERISSEGASFISCLQVRPICQRRGIGHHMMPRALKAILREHGSVWGVVSRYELLSWYQSLGAQVLSPKENKDNLWIILWTSETQG